MKEREDDFWRLKGKQKYELRGENEDVDDTIIVAKTKRERERIREFVSERNTLILAKLNANLTCSTAHPSYSEQMVHRPFVLSALVTLAYYFCKVYNP